MKDLYVCRYSLYVHTVQGRNWDGMGWVCDCARDGTDVVRYLVPALGRVAGGMMQVASVGTRYSSVCLLAR